MSTTLERAACDRGVTAEERAAMARDGYLVVPNFFDAAATAELLSWTEALQAAPEQPGAALGLSRG